MSRVNPPPNLRIPKRFLANKEDRDYFQQLEFILFQLWKRSGGGENLIQVALNPKSITSARLDALEIAAAGGDALTSDETGFTVDSDKLTVDMVIA